MGQPTTGLTSPGHIVRVGHLPELGRSVTLSGAQCASRQSVLEFIRVRTDGECNDSEHSELDQSIDQRGCNASVPGDASVGDRWSGADDGRGFVRKEPLEGDVKEGGMQGRPGV